MCAEQDLAKKQCEASLSPSIRPTVPPFLGGTLPLTFRPPEAAAAATAAAAVPPTPAARRSKRSKEERAMVAGTVRAGGRGIIARSEASRKIFLCV